MSAIYILNRSIFLLLVILAEFIMPSIPFLLSKFRSLVTFFKLFFPIEVKFFLIRFFSSLLMVNQFANASSLSYFIFNAIIDEK